MDLEAGAPLDEADIVELVRKIPHNRLIRVGGLALVQTRRPIPSPTNCVDLCLDHAQQYVHVVHIPFGLLRDLMPIQTCKFSESAHFRRNSLVGNPLCMVHLHRLLSDVLRGVVGLLQRSAVVIDLPVHLCHVVALQNNKLEFGLGSLQH